MFGYTVLLGWSLVDRNWDNPIWLKVIYATLIPEIEKIPADSVNSKPN